MFKGLRQGVFNPFKHEPFGSKNYMMNPYTKNAQFFCKKQSEDFFGLYLDLNKIFLDLLHWQLEF